MIPRPLLASALSLLLGGTALAAAPAPAAAASRKAVTAPAGAEANPAVPAPAAVAEAKPAVPAPAPAAGAADGRAAGAEASAPRTGPLKLAAPGLTGVNLAPGEAEFFNDYFSEKLTAQGGIRITTRSDVQGVLGLERQKELLGCNDGDSECLAEIAGALGVDGLVIGSVAKFGNSYGINLKVISARDAQKWASVSGQVKDERAVLDFLETSAAGVARDVKRALGAEDAALGAAAAARDPAPLPEGAWVRYTERNALRLKFPIVGLRYDRRLTEFLWVGAEGRLGGLGFNLGDAGGVAAFDLALLARYEPAVIGPVGFGIQAGVAAGGYGVSSEVRTTGVSAVQLVVGAELSLWRNWRLALDLHLPFSEAVREQVGLGGQLSLSLGYQWLF